MKTPFEPRQWLSVAFSGVALFLCAVLYWEWGEGRRLEQELSQLRKVPVTTVSVQAPLPEFMLPDAESGFPEMISRSLFTISRRASGASTKGGRGAMKKGQFVLVGVTVTPSQRSALLRDVQTNKTETVAVGGLVRGMTLGEVESGRVVLMQGPESEELVLNVQTGPKGALPVAGAPATSPATVAPAKSPAPAASGPASGASAPPPVGAPKPVEAGSAPKTLPAQPPASPGKPQK